MKILLPTSSFPRHPEDGRGRFVFEYISSIAQKGHDITILAPAIENSFLIKNSTNIKIKSFRYSPSINLELYFSEMTLAEMVKRTNIGKLFLPFYAVCQTKSIINMIQKEEFHLIHNQWMLAEMNSQLAKKITLRKIPTLVTVHGADLSISERNLITRKVYLKIAHMSDIVLANSKYTKKRLIKLGVNSEKIQIQYQGLNQESFDKIKVLEKDPNLILFVGRLSKRKGVNYLLQAFKEVLSTNKSAKLIIVGIGPEYSSLKSFAKDLGIHGSVSFIKFIRRGELIELFKKASIFVIPSIVDEFGETETLGVVVIEASYCKTPVIASNLGGIPEVVEDQKTGLLVKPRDPKALSCAITKLFEDPELRRKFGINAKKKVEKQFTWDKISEGTLNLYSELIESRKIF